MPRQRRPLSVGERFGLLTVVSVRPTSFRCDCGNLVHRMPYAVYSSKNPSCGCQQRALKSKRRTDSPNYVLLGQEPASEGKAVYARFNVACRHCHAKLSISNAQLLNPKPNPNGCRNCVRIKREAKTRVFHDHAGEDELS